MFTRASMRARAEAGNCNEHMPENAKSHTTVRFGIRGARRRAHAGGPPAATRTAHGFAISDRRRRPAVARRGSETAVRACARAAVTSRFEILVVNVDTAPRRGEPGPTGTARAPGREARRGERGHGG